MNIDELRSAQSKERQKSDLQQLRESFYGDVADYVAELEAERDRIAEQTEDPFGSPEVQQLTNDIETAKDTAEAIYERRLGKIVKKASLVSAEMANPNDVTGLTTEEQTLFADLVDRIEENKTHMLEVIAGDAPPGSADASGADSSAQARARSNSDATVNSDATGTGQDANAPHPEDGFGDDSGADRDDSAADRDDSAADRDDTAADPRPGQSEAAAVAGEDDPVEDETPADPDVPDPGSVSAADLMGGDGENEPTADADDVGDATATDAAANTDAATDETNGPATSESAAGESADGTSNSDDANSADPANDRATLRVTRDVGEIFGVDEREYRLDAEDVVTLPEANADVLLEQGAAERLD